MCTRRWPELSFYSLLFTILQDGLRNLLHGLLVSCMNRGWSRLEWTFLERLLASLRGCSWCLVPLKKVTVSTSSDNATGTNSRSDMGFYGSTILGVSLSETWNLERILLQTQNCGPIHVFESPFRVSLTMNVIKEVLLGPVSAEYRPPLPVENGPYFKGSGGGWTTGTRFEPKRLQGCTLWPVTLCDRNCS
jgi:hypothetical protein